MMESIENLRRDLAELVPDGRAIARALFVSSGVSPGLLSAFNTKVCKLVKAIHDAKHDSRRTTPATFRILRAQLILRVHKTGIRELGASVDERGECHIYFLFGGTSRKGNPWRIKVPPTWNPEHLVDCPTQFPCPLILLNKEECGSVPFGRVYSVRYVAFGGDQTCRQLAVQATTGGTLRLVYSMKQAEEIAEELYRARFAELAGV